MPRTTPGSVARTAARGVRRSGIDALRRAVRARVRPAEHGWLGRALVASLAVGLIGAGPAAADTASFTQQGCSQWTVPTGVSSVAITASGGAGGPGTSGAGGGSGDQVSGRVAVTHG